MSCGLCLSAFGPGYSRTKRLKPATRIIDIEFSVALWPRVRGSERLELKVFTPNGHLYQTLAPQPAVGSLERGTGRTRLTARLPVAGTVPRSAARLEHGELVSRYEDSVHREAAVNTGRIPGTTNWVEMNPLRITELVAALPGAAYVTRQAVHTVAAVRRLEKAIERAFRLQDERRGTCFIEVVSACPSGWKMAPREANAWLEEHMLKEYPLGDLKAPPA